MAWAIPDEVALYRSAAGGLLRSDPVRNTVLLSVLAGLTRRSPRACSDAAPVFGWWPDDSAPRAAALQTPPWPMLLTAMPGECAAQLAQMLADRGAPLSGVNGAEAEATAGA